MAVFLLADDIYHAKALFYEEFNPFCRSKEGAASIQKRRWTLYTMIRIVIVDGQDSDRTITAKILSAQGDFDVVGTGKDGYDAMRLADSHKPDILLMDINLSYLDGIKTSSILNARYPRMAMLILTHMDDARHIQNAMSNGVSGYLLKNKDMENLADLIRVVHNSGFLIVPRIAAGCAWGKPHLKADRQCLVNLSSMELQIIHHVGEGLENQEIAEKMRLKMGTIRNHISVLLQKTTLRNRTQLAIFAMQNGLAKEAPVA
jgi:DNA-binding NarL/FixJ family response regulator